MKYKRLANLMSVKSRAPQGARGLKFRLLAGEEYGLAVAPRKGRVG